MVPMKSLTVFYCKKKFDFSDTFFVTPGSHCCFRLYFVVVHIEFGHWLSQCWTTILGLKMLLKSCFYCTSVLTGSNTCCCIKYLHLFLLDTKHYFISASFWFNILVNSVWTNMNMFANRLVKKWVFIPRISLIPYDGLELFTTWVLASKGKSIP